MRRCAVSAVPGVLDEMGHGVKPTTRACTPDVKGKHTKTSSENGKGGPARPALQTLHVVMVRDSVSLRDCLFLLLPRKGYLKTKK